MMNVVCIILHDSKHRFLLQHRNLKTARLPGYWAFFGGGIDEGETPLQAAERESLEELNYALQNPVLALEQDFAIENTPGHMKVFIDEYLQDKAKLKLKEGHSWGWFNREESLGCTMSAVDRKVIEAVDEYIRNKGKVSV